MGFISFNENYYRRKLEEYENKLLSDADIREAKQLLKVLDDLADEGYTNLNDRMEADFSCLTRLRAVLRRRGEIPFPIDHERLSDTVYGKNEYELRELIGDLVEEAEDHSRVSPNPFLEEIHRYCDWIGYEEDTAYVFLLRDAFLPYVFFRSRGRDNIHPWLISRRFLEDITETKDADDDIRLPLYEALESGHIQFGDYSAYCGERILPVLNGHPKLKTILLELLRPIEQDRILVIESGYMGTIPMMLRALDGRVDFRLFTTAPFLYETYRDRIFCRKYEDLRRFETLYSQDLFMRYSSYRGGKFYVNASADGSVKEKAVSEIAGMMR
jgi:hypothetical protein